MIKQKLSISAAVILIIFNLLISCSSQVDLPTLTLTPTMTQRSTPTETAVPTATRKPTPTTWVISSGTGLNYRAIHMSGNWGTNPEGVVSLPASYFEWLRDLNVNWVGISVAIFVDNSMDSTVERKYSGVLIPTFEDDVLVNVIRAFRKHGFNVYLTMAFEASPMRDHPVERWMLGDPYVYTRDSSISHEYWPWALDHPDHDRFVS
jgi:hypothetical protein